MLLNCGAGEDSWKSLGQQGDQTNPKGNQLWIFIGRIDAEAPIIWSPDIKCQFIGKDPDAEKDCRQEKRTTENEMFGWHHWFNGHKFGQTMRDGEGLGGLVCFSPWGHKIRHILVTEQQLHPHQLFHLSLLYHVHLLALIDILQFVYILKTLFPLQLCRMENIVNQNSGNLLKIFSRDLAKQFTNITSFHVS